MEYYRQQEEARLLKIKEEEEARKREEDERRRQEEAERRAKYDEIAAKQRQIEADAEERAKRERDAILQGKPDEGRPGRFVPSSLRKRIEEPDTRGRTDSLPPGEKPPPFSARGLSSRDDGDRWQRSERSVEAEREPPTGPPDGAAPARYQPPQRSTGKYEPPVRRETYSSDAPPPRSAGGRFGFGDQKELERPRGFGGDRGGEDRWSKGAASRPNVRSSSGYGSERTERPPLFAASKDEGDNWRRSSKPDIGRSKPQEDPAA